MNRCDLHVIVCQYCNPEWVGELMEDLRGQPVNLHLAPCVPGNVGAARAAGFAMGAAEYVSFADPDDRILPGAVAACIAALDADSTLGAVFTGEQLVTAFLDPVRSKPAALSPYNRERHLATPAHVHGLIVMRRALVEPWLDELHAFKVMPEWFLTLSIARAARLARVPMLGRLWRMHGKQATRTMGPLLEPERRAISELFASEADGCNLRRPA
jgi:hypothetical protein